MGYRFKGMDYIERAEYIEPIVRKGILSYLRGDSVEDCPYGNSQLCERNAWLAGYRDEQKGRAYLQPKRRKVSLRYEKES